MGPSEAKSANWMGAARVREAQENPLDTPTGKCTPPTPAATPTPLHGPREAEKASLPIGVGAVRASEMTRRGSTLDLNPPSCAGQPDFDPRI